MKPYPKKTPCLHTPGQCACFSFRVSRLLAAVALAASAMTAQASSTIYGLTADRQVDSAGGLSDVSTMMSGYSGSMGMTPVVVFQIPTLAAGQQFSATSISLYLQGNNGTPVFNGDLYGLGASSSSSVLASDFYVGSADVASTLLQRAFYTPAMTGGRVTTSANDLTIYLNNIYANGSGAGQYVFFRVSPDIAGLSNYTRYMTYSADTTLGAFYWPQLTYSTATIGWSTVPLGGGGFVSGLVSDSTGNDIYCRSDVGGAFRWDPANMMWNSITDKIVPVSTIGGSTLMSTASLAVDPNNSNQLYVAVGGNTPLQGIYASADHGATWSLINPSTTIVMLGNGQFRSFGERLQVDPNNSNIVWFGSSQAGLYKGVNSGGTWTWTQIPSTAVPFGTVASGENGGVTFVACDKNGASTIVYAGVYDSVGTTGGVYMSTDSGATWSKVGGATIPTPQRGVVATGSGTLYVTSGTVGVGKMVRGGSLALLSTLPTGINYRGVTTDATGALLYVAEGNSSTQWNNMWRSADGGTTWLRQITNTANPNTRGEPDGTPSQTGYWFGNVSSLLLNPANSNELWAADYFGAYWTPDAQDLGSTSGCVWYAVQKGQEETVMLALKNAPTGVRLMSGPGDVGGFFYTDITKRPSGTAGGVLINPRGGNNCSFDFCETNNNVWARSWDNSSGTGGSGAVSTDGGATWIAFGGIAVQTLTNSSSAATVTYDLTAYLAGQKAKGVNTVTLVLAAYKTDSTGNTMNFDSKEGATPPLLVINGSTNLSATADSYTSSGSTGTNYGTATKLVVNYAYSSANLRSYLKFDLSSVSSITSAVLQLNRQSSANTTSYTVGVYGCANTTWTETGITWANMPATLASNTDPVVSPNYYDGASQLRGGRIAISSSDSTNLVWMPEGASNYPRYSKDRGATWTVCTGAPKSQVSNLYTPGVILQQLASDRVNGKFYVAQFSTGSGSNTVYSSTDGGATFSVAGVMTGGNYNTYRSQLVAAPVANDLWISDDGVSSTAAGGLWHSTDGGVNWIKQTSLTAISEVTFGAPLPGSGQPYAVFINGYKSSVRGVYRSDDKGATWVKLADAPTVSNIQVLAGDRQNYGYVFIGTSRGVYVGH